MLKPEWWSVIISAIALAIATWSAWALAKKQEQFEIRLRKLTALEEAKRLAVRHKSQIGGMLNAAEIAAQKGDFSTQSLKEPAKLYSEVRNLYQGIRHHFSAQSKQKVDSFIEHIESFHSAVKSGEIPVEFVMAYIEFPGRFLAVVEEEISANDGS